jgi:hypothetical protein
LLAAQGVPLGPEFRVNTYTTDRQHHPSIAFDSTGGFVVVWTSEYQDGSTSGAFGQRYASTGAPSGGEFRVNSYTTDRQWEPSVASDSAGNFVVAWQSLLQDGSYEGIFAQRYASTGAALGGEFRVNSYTTFAQARPSAGSDPAGGFVVTWQSNTQDGNSTGIYAQRYAGTGNPLGGEFRVNTYTSSYQEYPSVACDSVGNFVVVWESSYQDGSFQGVFGQRYSSTGAPLGGEFRVNSYTTREQRAPAVAVDAVGNFVVTWSSYRQDGAGWGIFGQRYASTGSPLGGEFRVNTSTLSFEELPSVAADSAGNFVVAWMTYVSPGSTWDVRGQRYDSSGAPLGGEFGVNTYVTSAQSYPAIASDPAGHFVVVWNSYAQDGDYQGIFAQRYSLISPVELQSFRVE